MLVLIISLLALTKPTMANDNNNDIPYDFNHSYFPDDFILRQPLLLTRLKVKQPQWAEDLLFGHIFQRDSRILDGSNGDVVVDFYNCFQVEGDMKE
ncbi:hypothetical protein GH714_009664 [Hevea brasiliensis]|uniref:Uncharacterized protein n=1 Tax=Hevea brasiliensis TaxID=3981 RepID=A0A6A6KKR1_HEVBR|nr:hypothetical protein GH714_009664 [Hevea brasiliensis]